MNPQGISTWRNAVLVAEKANLRSLKLTKVKVGRGLTAATILADTDPSENGPLPSHLIPLQPLPLKLLPFSEKKSTVFYNLVSIWGLP